MKPTKLGLKPPDTLNQRAAIAVTDKQESTVGMIAGWGDYPVVIARKLIADGRRLVTVGVRDHTCTELKELSHEYVEVGLGQLGRAIRFFRRHGVAQATMAGKIHKVRIFQRLTVLRHLPDWMGVKTFYSLYLGRRQDRRDDSMLLAIVKVFADHQIDFVPATDFLPELFVKFGILAGRRLTTRQKADIEVGWQLAKALGEHDAGQTVVVRGRAAMAIEAVEGTDECIRRAGHLCQQGGFTVVKVAKPQQDMRFDVPTIGESTIRSIAEGGGKCLAVEADKTIGLMQDDLARLAEQCGITVVAIHDGIVPKNMMQSDAA